MQEDTTTDYGARHGITVIAGQVRRMTLRMLDDGGELLPVDRYAVTGAVSSRSGVWYEIDVTTTGDGYMLTIPALNESELTAGTFDYDVFARRADGLTLRLLYGRVKVLSRVTKPGDEYTSDEAVTVEVSEVTDDVTVTIKEITAVAPADWADIQDARDRAEDAADRATATLPALTQEIEGGKQAIHEAALSGTADVAQAVDDGIDRVHVAANAAVDDARLRITDDTNTALAGALVSMGDAATANTDTAKSEITTHTTQEMGRVTTATNDGVNTIGQSITSGTGSINQAVTSGMTVLDAYVVTVQDDIARRSKPGQWSGIQTLNAPLIANGGIIIQPTAAATSVSTHMSAWLWASTYCTERAIPYNGSWTLRDDRGLRGEYETVLYSAISSSTYSTYTTTFSRFDVAFLVSERNYNTQTIKRQVVGIDVQRGSSYTARSGKYPWDWCADREVRIIASPHHAVKCIQIRQAIVTNPAGLMGWRMIYPRGIDDLLSMQIISRGSEWHDPVYAMMYADDILGIEALFTPSTHPDVTANQMTSSILQSMSIIGCHTYANLRSQNLHPTPPAITTYKHALPYHDWTRPKAWTEEQAIRTAINKTWIDWRYIAASLDYTPAQAERAIVTNSSNIGRHIYVTATAQDIGLAASVYRPKAGDDTLLPDGVIVDIDTASSWLTHSDGALHLTANASGAERIASVWLYSDQSVGTILELQIHQSAS